MRTQIKRLSNTEIKWTALLFYHYMVLQTQWHSIYNLLQKHDSLVAIGSSFLLSQ